MPLQFVAQGPMLISAAVGLTPFLWLDATVGVTSSTTLVSAWLDTQSGNAWNFVQATGSSQPTTTTASQGGLNVINFALGTGTPRFLDCTTFARAQPFTVISVISSVTGAAGFLFDSTTGSNRVIQLANATGSGLTQISALGTALDDTVNVGTGFVVIASVFDGSGATNSKIYSNGSLDATSAAGIGTNNFVNGDGMRIGDRFANASTQWTGLIAEIQIYNSVVSPANIASITTGLRSKWGF